MRTILVVVMIGLSFSVAACGRKAAPKPLANSFYPQRYPPNQQGETWAQPVDDQKPQPAAPQQ